VLYLLALPSALYFLVFAFYPVVSGVSISLQDFRFVGESRFIGLANFREVVTTPGFWRVFANTLILGFGNVTLTAMVPMGLAVMINELGRRSWRRFLQTLIYTPHLFSWVVVGGIWIFILSPSGGLVNSIRQALGFESIYFMATLRYARTILIGVNLWKQAGFVCILYLASIAGINPELYEAAMIDGAGWFGRIIHVTLPGLTDTLKVVLLLNVMGSLRLFDQVYVMRNEVIAPKIDVLMYYVYIRGLQQFKIGYAAAVSVIVFVATLAVSLMTRRSLRYRI
jgi:putative aldouronate transport system permease protein